MNKLRENKGFTLIEMVVVIAVLGLLLSGVVTIVGFAADFFKSEDSAVVRQQNVRLVTVNFEKDVRKSSQSVTLSSGCVLIDSTDYCLIGNEVMRDDVKIADDIATFEVVIADDGSYLDLSVASTPDERGQAVTAATRIYLRKGD